MRVCMDQGHDLVERISLFDVFFFWFICRVLQVSALFWLVSLHTNILF